MTVARKAASEVSDLKTTKPLAVKSVVSSEVGEKCTERQNSSGAIDEFCNHVTNLKSLVTSVLCEIRHPIDRVKHPLVNNQSGAGRQSSMGF